MSAWKSFIVNGREFLFSKKSIFNIKHYYRAPDGELFPVGEDTTAQDIFKWVRSWFLKELYLIYVTLNKDGSLGYNRVARFNTVNQCRTAWVKGLKYYPRELTNRVIVGGFALNLKGELKWAYTNDASFAIPEDNKLNSLMPTLESIESEIFFELHPPLPEDIGDGGIQCPGESVYLL